MKPKVITFAQTCYACPSQWQGTLDNGDGFYVRYRWGTLSLGVGANHSYAVRNAVDRIEPEGGPLDGYMNTDTMKAYINEFDWSEAKQLN